MGLDRQKIIMIFAGAWVSAALLTWFVFSRTAGATTEEMIRVAAAARDLPAGTRLKKSDVQMARVAKAFVPSAAVTDDKAVLERVLLHPLNRGETIVTTKLTGVSGADGIAATILPGMRAISVPIKDETSAGGLIQPRSRVDVLFTRTGSMREALTSTILQDVVVMSVGKQTEVDTQQVDPAKAQQQATMTRAATLMVTPEQAAKIELAKNQGKISLVLRNPTDKSTVEATSATAEALDPDIFAGAARALRSSVRAANVPNVRDDKVWAQLSGGAAPAAEGSPDKAAEKKELPKPRFVVDVYRGDKHVQEIFQ